MQREEEREEESVRAYVQKSLISGVAKAHPIQRAMPKAAAAARPPMMLV